MSAMASKKSPTSRLFAQPFLQAQIKENIKALRHWLFVREIHRWPVDSPHKWPVTRKMFPFDDVIMDTEMQMWPSLAGSVILTTSDSASDEIAAKWLHIRFIDANHTRKLVIWLRFCPHEDEWCSVENNSWNSFNVLWGLEYELWAMFKF